MSETPNKQAYILKPNYSEYSNIGQGSEYVLTLEWEAGIMSFNDTVDGPLPDPLIFDGDFTKLDGLDYPYNNMGWPIMSRRMLEVLLSVGSFPHRIIPLTVRNSDGQLDPARYVAVQLTEHLDLLDEANSVSAEYEYVFEDGYSQTWDGVTILTTIALKNPTTALPPLFKLSSFPWPLLISAEGRAALEQATINGVAFQALDETRQLLTDDFSLFSPVELDNFAGHYNWDDGIDTMLFLIRCPNCDRGTALQVYWKAGPGYYLQYSSRDNILESYRAQYAIRKGDIVNTEFAENLASASMKTYDFLREIERRYQNGFYHYKDIFFNPRNDTTKWGNNQDWTTNYADVPKAAGQALPAIMLEPSIEPPK